MLRYLFPRNLSLRFHLVARQMSRNVRKRQTSVGVLQNVGKVFNAPDSQRDEDDLVSSYEFVLDMVEVEHSDTDRLLQSASL